MTLGQFSLTAYGSVSTNWPNKVKTYFEDTIADMIYEDYTYMTVDAFDNAASTWAASYLTSAESSDLHSNMFSLSFDLDVTYGGSNGVSSTKNFAFTYMISGRFFDIAVRSLSTETDSHTF